VTYKRWKQPKFKKKMWHIYTMEFYAAIKKIEIMLFASKWMELENFLSKVNQGQITERSHIFSQMWKLDLYVKCSSGNIYDLLYMHIYIYVCVYIYIYIVTERTKLY
jgi:hypothetical protein